MRLENKVAFVTGGGSGLGRAVAERYAREGARVVVAEVNEAGGRETEESIRRNGGEGLFLQCDLNREDQVAAMVGVTKARFGRIDILHNNAAILLREAEGLLHTISSDVWDRTFQANARGVFQSFLDRIPLGRLGRPEDMAGISVFLASDDAAYCTGGVYTVDGGLTAY